MDEFIPIFITENATIDECPDTGAMLIKFSRGGTTLRIHHDTPTSEFCKVEVLEETEEE
jgi:hypothetical protein